jgi:GntR family transcriptional regulator, galactonate operon transcriptional repressor
MYGISMPDSTERLPMTRLHEAIVKALVKDISSGAYAPGSTLPTENDLAEAHGVSRTAAREVMQTLRTLGLVEIRRRKGATVLPRRDWNMLDPTVLSLTIENASDLEIYRSLVEARLAIEPRAAELAARRADPADLARIEAALDAMAAEAQGTQGEGWPDADLAFHAAVIDASGNWVFRQLVVMIKAALEASIRLTGGHHDSSQAALQQHRDVFNAIKRKQPEEAVAAMTWMLQGTRRDLERLEMAQMAQVRDSGVNR